MTQTELKTEVESKFSSLRQADWLIKIRTHGIEHKKNSQLSDLIEFYPQKLTRVQKQLNFLKSMPVLTETQKSEIKITIAALLALKDQTKAELKDADKDTREILIQEIGEIYQQIDQYNEVLDREERIQGLTEKAERIKSKFASVLKEVEYRDKKVVSRTPIGTTYYIDFTNGLDANDGLSTVTAWKTLGQYTSVTVRTAGDIAYVRANQTHTYNTADITFDEDGTVNSYLSIIGCNVTQGIDPWSDGSDVKPIISFGDAAYQCNMDIDTHWYFKNLEFIESADTQSSFIISTASICTFINCIFRDSASLGCKSNYAKLYLEDCQFYNNLTTNFYNIYSYSCLSGCIFNGGALTTDFGLLNYDGVVDMKNCGFGQTTVHDSADIREDGVGVSYIYGRNIKLGSTSEVVVTTGSYFNKCFVKIEDYEGTKGTNKSWYQHGTVQKQTTSLRSGGGLSRAEVYPNARCGLYRPLTLTDDVLSGDFRIWCSASATTVTVYIRGIGWASFPTASELYIQAEYWNDAGTAIRALSTASTQVLTDNTTWVAFTTTFTPVAAGWVYVKVNLKKYTASCGIDVDVMPVVS